MQIFLFFPFSPPTFFLNSNKHLLYLTYPDISYSLQITKQLHCKVKKHSPKKTIIYKCYLSETSDLILDVTSFIRNPRHLGPPKGKLLQRPISFHIFFLFAYVLSQVKSPFGWLQFQMASVMLCISPVLPIWIRLQHSKHPRCGLSGLQFLGKRVFNLN